MKKRKTVKAWALIVDDGSFASNGLHDDSPPRLFRRRPEAKEYRDTYWHANTAKIVRVNITVQP